MPFTSYNIKLKGESYFVKLKKDSVRVSYKNR